MIPFRTTKSRRAFTLIELLIVITIIGILAVALIPKIASAPSRARDAQRKTDLNTIAIALEAYYADYSAYPTAASGACINSTAISGFDKYFNVSDIPNDPSGATNGPVTGTCTTKGDYYYQSLDSAQHYGIAVNLENDPYGSTAAPGNVLSASLTGVTTTGTASSGVYYKSTIGEVCYSSTVTNTCIFVIVK